MSRKVLLGAVALTVVATAGVFVYWATLPAVPDVPKIDLDDVDPEITAAIKQALDAVKQSPRSAPAWGKLGIVLQANGFDETAHDGYGTAALLAPKDPTWPYLQGYLHHKGYAGPEAALPYFQRAAALGPANSVARIMLADMLLEQGRLDEAEGEYRKVLSADEKDPQALFGLAKLALAREQFQESLDYLRLVQSNRHVQNQACAMRATVYERLGEQVEAERERRRLAQLPEDDPRSTDPMIQVAQAEVGLRGRLARAGRLWQRNRFPELVELLQETVRMYPRSDAAWSNLGLALARIDQPEAAEQAVNKSIELAPKSAEYRYNLGMIELSQRRYAQAAENFRRALAMRPSSAPAHLGLGECLEELRDVRGAADSYRAVLKFQPGNSEARGRLERLEQTD